MAKKKKDWKKMDSKRRDKYSLLIREPNTGRLLLIIFKKLFLSKMLCSFKCMYIYTYEFLSLCSEKL